MIYPTNYDLVKRLTEERRARSLAKYELFHRRAPEAHPSFTEERDAEVIELTFGAQCESEPIGA
jgi:hypothetical protein